MKVVLFHPKRLPPRDYGGVERVVGWLGKGLVECGHGVWIAARAGSRLPAGCRLLEVDEKNRDPGTWLKQLPSGIDLIHFMAPPGEATWQRAAERAAVLLTVHGNGKAGEIFPANTVFLSQNHATRHGRETFVYNGIDPAEFEFLPTTEKSPAVLFFSKTTWKVKNLHGAMRICAGAGVPLTIAGGRGPLRLRLQSWIRPGWHWLGPVTGGEKARMLAEARALIFPILWEEPFGLVVIEALISGTPVLASPRGSMPEIVTAEVGRLPRNEEEWMEAVRSPGRFDAERCRQHVLERFHYLRMAQSYAELYQSVMSGGKLK